ncbi:MAG: SDR family NAD(P)-dependent oxidoreductase [Solirubrobacteraceae bacterium]
MLEIDLGGVINGVRAFLPILLAQASGVIVNTFSVFGLVGMPGQSAYTERASKIIHEGVKRGRGRILVGPDACAFDALARLAPTHYFDIIAALEPLAGRRRAQAG